VILDKKKPNVKSLADGLEPYRRLVELQKQMIELVRQHKKTKGECAALREQLLDEMTRRRHSRWSFRRITGRPTAGWVNNLANAWKPRTENRAQPDGSVLPFC
jgi:hypothetical protein